MTLAFCDVCDRDVLLHLDYDANGNERFLCVYCDRPIDAGLRAVSDQELGDSGYGLVEEPRGCGSGACGSGGCPRRAP